uniref:Uncharacterized protein n=1 Tax=Ascaris lumbricoides TaxID=6252 RepID=A0A0M3ICW9_ASCLU
MSGSFLFRRLTLRETLRKSHAMRMSHFIFIIHQTSYVRAFARHPTSENLSDDGMGGRGVDPILPIPKI